MRTKHLPKVKWQPVPPHLAELDENLWESLWDTKTPTPSGRDAIRFVKYLEVLDD